MRSNRVCSPRLAALASLPLLAFTLAARVASAGDLFVVSAHSTTTSVTVRGNRLPDLLDDLGDVTGQFAALDGQAFVGSITYAGVPNAVAVDYDPDGAGAGIATLRVTSLLGSDAGSLPTFSEANGDLGTQLEDYFLKDAPQVIANFQRAVAASTPVSPVSGNPASAVGSIIKYRDHRFGLYRIQFGGGRPSGEPAAVVESETTASGTGADSPSPSGKGGGTWSGMITGSGGTMTAGGFSGTYATIEPSLALAFHENASIVLGVPVSYTSWEGTSSGSVGLQLDMPITLVNRRGTAGGQSWNADVRWTVTPGGGTVGAFSYDLAEGGLLWNAGVMSVVELADEEWSLALSQQYEHFSSISLSYEEYVVDYGASQDVLSFGARLARKLGDGFCAYAGTTWNTTLDGDAYISDWFEPMAGVAWQFDDGGTLNVGFEGEFGDQDWQAWGGQVSLSFPF